MVERNHKHNIEITERLKVRNADLETEYTAQKANYIEIKTNIPPEDIEAVQDERYAVRNAEIKRVREALQKAYGAKYSYDIFREAETAVNNDLGEKAFSIKKCLQRNRHHSTEQNHRSKHKNYKQER